MVPGHRIEYRPALKENKFFLTIMNGVAAFVVLIALIGNASAWGLWTWAQFALLLLGFGLLPWLYLLSLMLWLDDTNLGAASLLFRRRVVPRHAIRRVVGTVGGVVFLGSDDRVLLKAPPMLSNDQVRAVAAELGLKAEGIGKWWVPL